MNQTLYIVNVWERHGERWSARGARLHTLDRSKAEAVAREYNPDYPKAAPHWDDVRVEIDTAVLDAHTPI